MAVRRGELARPAGPSPRAELVRAKGAAHEPAYLQSLVESGRRVARIDTAGGLESARQPCRR